MKSKNNLVYFFVAFVVLALFLYFTLVYINRYEHYSSYDLFNFILVALFVTLLASFFIIFNFFKILAGMMKKDIHKSRIFVITLVLFTIPFLLIINLYHFKTGFSHESSYINQVTFMRTMNNRNTPAWERKSVLRTDTNDDVYIHEFLTLKSDSLFAWEKDSEKIGLFTPFLYWLNAIDYEQVHQSALELCKDGLWQKIPPLDPSAKLSSDDSLLVFLYKIRIDSNRLYLHHVDYKKIPVNEPALRVY